MDIKDSNDVKDITDFMDIKDFIDSKHTTLYRKENSYSTLFLPLRQNSLF